MEGVFTGVAVAFEVIGALAMCIGFVTAVVLAIRALSRGEGGQAAFQVLRTTLGAAILLGLEVLVAADLIRTITSKPSLEDALILGLIVLIRTILSMSIQIEIEGVLPWRRALLTSGGQVIGQAIARDRAATAQAKPERTPGSGAGSEEADAVREDADAAAAPHDASALAVHGSIGAEPAEEATVVDVRRRTTAGVSAAVAPVVTEFPPMSEDWVPPKPPPPGPLRSSATGPTPAVVAASASSDPSVPPAAPTRAPTVATGLGASSRPTLPSTPPEVQTPFSAPAAASRADRPATVYPDIPDATEPRRRRSTSAG
jgi:uncharacterized membrane protein